MVVDSEDEFKCKNCFELFQGCGKCSSDACTACQNSTWILTPNGCAYEEEEPELVLDSESMPEFVIDPSESSPSVRPIVDHSSVTNGSGGNDGSSKAGLIAGVVVAVVVVAAVAAVAIYCVVTTGRKHGPISQDIYEKDVEFESMSVL